MPTRGDVAPFPEGVVRHGKVHHIYCFKEYSYNNIKLKRLSCVKPTVLTDLLPVRRIVYMSAESDCRLCGEWDGIFWREKDFSADYHSGMVYFSK